MLHILKILASNLNVEAWVQCPATARDLYWTKWPLGRFFFKHFGFLLSVSFHKCYIDIHSATTDAVCP